MISPLVLLEILILLVVLIGVSFALRWDATSGGLPGDETRAINESNAVDSTANDDGRGESENTLEPRD